MERMGGLGGKCKMYKEVGCTDSVFEDLEV